MSIAIENISKQFGSFSALKDVSLSIPSGELVALLGPSGSGKTTLLRLIAGLEAADAGKILFNGEDTTERHVRERRVGFVFQHYALFRHMTVFENVAFGLRVRPRSTRPSNAEIKERVMALLRLVQLEAMAGRYPSQLSGGQRQRIALARALAVEPQVLLLDEPFGALDAQVRAELRRWLRRLHDEIHVTSVFVTHDQEEALEVADRIVVMDQGRIVQSGTPDEVYEHPASPFVLNFLGNVNLFRGRVHQGQATVGGIQLEAPEHAGTEDAPALAFVRSHDLEIDRNPSNTSAMKAEVSHIQKLGPAVRVTLVLENGEFLEAELTREQYRNQELQQGESVYVRPRQVRVFVEDYQDYQI
ncbi:sulfate/molybdate ABC transporter ATP-binding protein [Geobacter sp. SVR]|uniref:sulfate/molybdate ABC transporter ATP-binding protein n=1 Tax=Geobacter sp. SVR TaxID=2495594 RepID=UPI00143EFA70|nr:sulfate/molybdate ABC transporter ATP-binding protein [Geobacter sp. SVR]BCS53388.1 sulfate/thiosulfate import ATP-binding protein CysA [Geobacter sp. SVR]GCF85486.1 sulfate/thiosulfate import ATP-binding protein CysA [Geobacter sp. SVR]